MHILILLLRGINVGRTKRISMQEFHALCTQAGCSDCRTYVQSGNACVVHDAPNVFLETLSELLHKRFSAPVALFAYTPEQWTTLIHHLPFPKTPMPYVCFLKQALSIDQRAQIETYLSEEESIELYDTFLYYCKKTPKTTQFSNALVERITHQECTTRNWNTVSAMHQLAQTTFC